MKSKKLASLLSAIGLGLALASPPASALIQFYSPVTAFQDDDLDFIFDNDQSGTVTVGDRLVTVFEYTNTQGVLAGQGPTNIGPEELTGVLDITLVALLGGGVAVWAPTGAGGLLAGFAAGTAAAVWTDATPDLNVINATCGTRAQCVALAGLGGGDGSALYLTVGFFGDPDASLVSTGVAPLISTIENGGSSTPFGSLFFGLDIGINNTGFAFLENQSCVPFCTPGGNGFVTITGQGSILGGQNLDHTQWTGRSDNDAQVSPAVPEPASLALVGLALAGLGAMRRRNRTAG